MPRTPTMPPTMCTPTTSSESSYPNLYLRPTAQAQTTPAATPISSAPRGESEPQLGVIATSPATMPEAAPSEVACPSRNRSTSNQPRVPDAPAHRVVTNTTAAAWPAPSAEPALKPNQPNQSSPAPSITRV